MLAAPTLGELVELRVDADLAQLPLVRTMTAAVAMRRDYDVESLADLRLAVDEACTLLVRRALPFSALTVRLRVAEAWVDVHCSVPVLDPTPIDESGLGWTLLSALVESMTTGVADEDVFAELTIELRMAKKAAA
ncbi:anti-sigma regulatory factor [Actinokineospora sp. NBRC 105648]|nr:anti-sigma regulatory factor [Actinokineospora sp. NBRC 105648]